MPAWYSSVGTSDDHGETRLSVTAEKTPQNKILMLMGSESDREIMEKGAQVLRGHGCDVTLKVSSAHRQPDRTAAFAKGAEDCLLYTSPSPRDRTRSRMPSSA